jgi:aryl-alcohol dehydrogenase (NADP+)
LGTDRIDVYQFHGPAEVLPELVAQLDDLVVVGDVGRFGVGADSVASADLWVGVDGIGVVQVPFGVLDPDAAATTIPLAQRHAREVWARGVLGGGLLGLAGRDPDALADDPQRPRVERLRQIAADSGLDVFRLALGYVRAHTGVSTVLFGSTNLDHLRRNVDALAAPPLDESVLAALDAVAKTGSR